MNENEYRFVGKTLSSIKIMKWHDYEVKRYFYDLYYDDKFIVRCDSAFEVGQHIEMMCLAEEIER